MSYCHNTHPTVFGDISQTSSSGTAYTPLRRAVTRALDYRVGPGLPASRAQPVGSFAEEVLRCLEIRFYTEDDDLAPIPASGPVIFASSHVARPSRMNGFLGRFFRAKSDVRL
jgi:hypothetical protein